MVLCAVVSGLGLAVAFVDHPIAMVLRVKLREEFAGEPAILLDFKREPGDGPVLSSGTADTPMLVMDPCVISDGDGLHLFFSSVFCETPDGLSLFWKPEFGDEFDISKLTTGIAYAFSDDRGKNWRIRAAPVLLPAEGGWDGYRVETASAVVVDDVLHLFYSGDAKESPARYEIGEASLELNGDTLRTALLEREHSPVRKRTSPVLAGVRDRSCFRNNVQEPSVLYHDGRFELYFVGLQFSQPGEALDHAGQELRGLGLGRAILDDSLKPIEVTDEPLVELANIIEVKRTAGGLVLFTTLPGEGDAHEGERIGYQTSPDGRSWSRSREILSSRPMGFDSWGCMSPTVVQDSDRWILFYTALEKSSDRPSGRWGISMGDGWLFGTLGRAESAAP